MLNKISFSQRSINRSGPSFSYYGYGDTGLLGMGLNIGVGVLFNLRTGKERSSIALTQHYGIGALRFGEDRAEICSYPFVWLSNSHQDYQSSCP